MIIWAPTGGLMVNPWPAKYQAKQHFAHRQFSMHEDSSAMDSGLEAHTEANPELGPQGPDRGETVLVGRKQSRLSRRGKYISRAWYFKMYLLLRRLLIRYQRGLPET